MELVFNEGIKEDISYCARNLNLQELEQLPSYENTLDSEQSLWVSSSQNWETEMNRRVNSLEDEHKIALEKLNQERNQAISNLQNELSVLQETLQDYQTELSSLCALRFSKRNACKKKIEETVALMERKKNMLSGLNKNDNSDNHTQCIFQRIQLSMLEDMSNSGIFSASPQQKLNAKNALIENWSKFLDEHFKSRASNWEYTCYILIILERFPFGATVEQIIALLNYIVEEFLNYGSTHPTTLYEKCYTHPISNNVQPYLSRQKVFTQLANLVKDGVIERLDCCGPESIFRIKNK